MVHRDSVIANEASGAVRTVLAADAAGDGTLARDAVQLVADLVKRRKCLAPPQTVEVLLGLTLRSAKASDVKSGGESLLHGAFKGLLMSQQVSMKRPCCRHKASEPQ